MFEKNSFMLMTNEMLANFNIRTQKYLFLHKKGMSFEDRAYIR